MTNVRISTPTISFEAARFMKAVLNQGNKCKSVYDCEVEIGEKMFDRLITLGLMEKVLVESDNTPEIKACRDAILVRRVEMKVKSCDIDEAATELNGYIGMIPDEPTPKELDKLSKLSDNLRKVSSLPVQDYLSSIQTLNYTMSKKRYSDIYYQVTKLGIMLLDNGTISISI